MQENESTSNTLACANHCIENKYPIKTLAWSMRNTKKQSYECLMDSVMKYFI